MSALAAPGFNLACPSCRQVLQIGEREARCAPCGTTYEREDGIWRMLLPDRAARLQPSTRQYEAVRRSEGWGSEDPAYYRELPFRDTSGRFAATWRIRASTYRALQWRVLRSLSRRLGRPLRVLDLGAGNGWLSHRLSERGHRVAAVDLLTNDRDGLGVHRIVGGDVVPVQAEFDRLPFGDGEADVAIFNASLHYTPDYRVTLDEARRVVAPTGLVVIADTPFYHDRASGEEMVREWEARLLREHGFAPEAPAREGFLTYHRLAELASSLNLRVRVVRPLRWWPMRVRAVLATVRGRRETATFPVIVAERRGRPTEPGAARFRAGSLRARLARLSLRTRFLLFQRHRHRRLVLERFAGRPLVVLPDVFNPNLFLTTEFFASILSPELIPPTSRVLDLGTGSGALAIVAAALSGSVTAVDVNPEAARCARLNVLLNHCEGRVSVLEGDLFAPVAGQRFDVVLCNPPFYRGSPRDLWDASWRAPDFFERFTERLADHLEPSGYALVLVSSLAETEPFFAGCAANGLTADPARRRALASEEFTVYRVRRAP